jgi:hypothetical protein
MSGTIVLDPVLIPASEPWANHVKTVAWIYKGTHGAAARMGCTLCPLSLTIRTDKNREMNPMDRRFWGTHFTMLHPEAVR